MYSLVTHIPMKQPKPANTKFVNNEILQKVQKFYIEVSIPRWKNITKTTIVGYIIWNRQFDKKRPKKQALGLYILFDSSLFIIGACNGIYKTVATAELVLIWLLNMKASPLRFKLNSLYLLTAFSRPSYPAIFSRSGNFPTQYYTDMSINAAKKELKVTP